MTTSRQGLILRSAVIAPLYLIGSLLVGAIVGDLIFLGLPGHMQDAARIALAALPALASVTLGGALWGRAMARLVRPHRLTALTWGGALGYGPILIVVALGLTLLENLIVEQHGGPELPIHVVFTILFVPAVFLVAAAGGFALGVALKRRSIVPALALGSGFAAAIAFLVVDILMDSVGYRVGAPGATDRATMVTVLLTGTVAASLAAGAVIGFVLGRGQETS